MDAGNPREGHTFEGWYADKEYTTPWNFNNAITSNTKIWAKWIATVTSVSISPNTTQTKNLNCTKIEQITFTATADNATDYEWYVDDVMQGETSNTFNFTTPAGNGAYVIYAKATNMYTATPPTSTSVTVTVTRCATVNSSLTATPYNGKLKFMCYNLGANPIKTIDEQMAYAPTGDSDATVFGDLYQWGRRADGHEKRTSARYPTNDASSESGAVSGANLDATGQVINTHSAFGKFIKNNANPFDWRTPQTETLWNRDTEAAPVKTTNDPCPDGWRVPTKAEWASILSPTNTWTETNVGTKGHKVSTDGGLTYDLFIPAAGGRMYTTGGLTGVGLYGYYWSSTPNGILAYGLYSNPFSTNGYVRTYGFSVRCVAEH